MPLTTDAASTLSTRVRQLSTPCYDARPDGATPNTAQSASDTNAGVTHGVASPTQSRGHSRILGHQLSVSAGSPTSTPPVVAGVAHSTILPFAPSPSRVPSAPPWSHIRARHRMGESPVACVSGDQGRRLPHQEGKIAIRAPELDWFDASDAHRTDPTSRPSCKSRSSKTGPAGRSDAPAPCCSTTTSSRSGCSATAEPRRVRSNAE